MKSDKVVTRSINIPGYVQLNNVYTLALESAINKALSRGVSVEGLGKKVDGFAGVIQFTSPVFDGLNSFPRALHFKASTSIATTVTTNGAGADILVLFSLQGKPLTGATFTGGRNPVAIMAKVRGSSTRAGHTLHALEDVELANKTVGMLYKKITQCLGQSPAPEAPVKPRLPIDEPKGEV
jgi:hypothetical protein